MKYTMSKDGELRMDIHATIRVTKDEYAELRKLAKEAEISPGEMLDLMLENGFYNKVLEMREEDNYDYPRSED